MKRIVSFLLILITLVSFCAVIGVTDAIAVDGEAEAHEHKWTKATCTSPKTCSVCGATEGKALGHKVEKWKTAVKPTCTEEGRKSGKCTRCGETVTKAVKATGHKVTKWKTLVKATCTEGGSKSGKCTLCGETVKKDTKPTGHTPGEKWKYALKPTSGNLTMIRYKECKTCGGECSREVKTLTMAQYKTWYKKQCTTRLGYKTLVRNPDKYKGRMIKVVGRVLQVQEYSGWNPYIILRVATRGSSADVMYVKINGKMGRRILESDRVTLWGEFSGLETYRSPLGESVTIPRIDAEFYSVR